MRAISRLLIVAAALLLAPGTAPAKGGHAGVGGGATQKAEAPKP